MKSIKKIISLCLILCICISGIQVSADSNYVEQSIEIESVSGTEIYNVLKIQDDIYMAASDYAKITRYEYQEGPDTVMFTLGNKYVSVSKKGNGLSLPIQNYHTEFSNPVEYNGTTYISMHELLPWLNVNCFVEGNKFIVTSDAISLWELSKVLIDDLETYKFNLYEDMGETEASSIGLAAAMLFDTIVNIRFDKLIPVGDGILDPAGSLYDYNCYRDLYIDMATDDTLISEQAEGVIKKSFEINKNIGTIEDALGIDEDELSTQGNQFLLDLGVNLETLNDYTTLSESWRNTRNILSSTSEVYEYFNPFKILKSYETLLHTTTEYRNYLNALKHEDDISTIMQMAVGEAIIRLNEKAGAVYSYLFDLGNTLVNKKIKDANKEVIKTAFEGTSWGSIFVYLDLAKIFYSTAVPVTDGMSEMSKFIIYSNISDYSWRKASEHIQKELTQENIAYICQSYMASLKSSKKAFEGMQTLYDSKAFGFSIFGNNDGLMNYRIEPTEEMLVKLALTSSCRENDSTENKNEKAKEIKELLEKISKKSNNEDVVNTYDYKKHLGTWYYTPFSDPEPSDFKPLAITDKGNNKAEISWYDGTIEQIIFISDNVAHGERSISEYCSVEVPSGISEQRKNVPIVNVYDFTPLNGNESMYVCQRTTDTDRLVIAEWQRAVRNVDNVFSNTYAPINAERSEDEAQKTSENTISDTLLHLDPGAPQQYGCNYHVSEETAIALIKQKYGITVKLESTGNTAFYFSGEGHRFRVERWYVNDNIDDVVIEEIQ